MTRSPAESRRSTDWLVDEFARASEQYDALPKSCRPIVTPSRVTARATHPASRTYEDEATA